MWLYLLKYVFTCSIFVDSNTKIFLSVLGVFRKYFVFTKLKNFKNSVSLFWRLSRGSSKSHASAASSRVNFGDLFASERSSRVGYSEIFAAQLTTPSLVDLPVVKNTLRNFSSFVFRGLPGNWLATWSSCEKHVFCVLRTVFQNFFSFPSNFLWLSTFTQLNLSQTLCVTLYNLHCCTCSPPNLQEKGMGSYSLTSYLVFWASFSWVFVLVFWLLLWVYFDVFGIVLVWIIKGFVPM